MKLPPVNWSADLNTFAYALVALLVIVDPPGTAVVFAAMTPKDTPAERASQARRACLVGFGVLAVFGLAGASLLQALGIGLPAMRIAGGALLFLTAAEMVTDRHALRSTDSERNAAIHTDQDIAIFPLGIPLIAGPAIRPSPTIALNLPKLRARRSSGVTSVTYAVATAMLAAVAPAIARPINSKDSVGAKTMNR